MYSPKTGCILESNTNERKAWQSETISMLFLYLGIEDWTEWRLYFEQTGTCCNTVYSLDPEIGKRIAGGESIEILPQNITQMQAGYKGWLKRCTDCGYETQEEFEYCPKCGRRF